MLLFNLLMMTGWAYVFGAAALAAAAAAMEHGQVLVESLRCSAIVAACCAAVHAAALSD
jgi:hypothetical protein